MPLYEYQCDACGCRYELIQKFSDAPMETCEACGGPVRKLHSAPAFQFKGTGWYITDYAKKDTPSPAGSRAAPADKPAKTDSAGTDGSSATAGGTAGSGAPATPVKSAPPKKS